MRAALIGLCGCLLLACAGQAPVRSVDLSKMIFVSDRPNLKILFLDRKTTQYIDKRQDRYRGVEEERHIFRTSHGDFQIGLIHFSDSGLLDFYQNDIWFVETQLQGTVLETLTIGGHRWHQIAKLNPDNSLSTGHYRRAGNDLILIGNFEPLDGLAADVAQFKHTRQMTPAFKKIVYETLKRSRLMYNIVH